MNNFDTSLKYVLKDEGGNDDDPNDHGGRTSRGITQREYNHWCSLHHKAGGDVWHATTEDIRSIYNEQYWQPYCQDLPNGVDYLFFDVSVNAGRTAAVRQFQKALGVKVDGMFGLETRQAIASSDPVDLITKISDVRRAFYKSLKQFSRYGRGWLSRVSHSESAALALAKSIPQVPLPTPPIVPQPKATEPSAPTISPETTATATGGLIATLEVFKEQIQGLSDSIPSLKFVILGIAVVGLGYAVYGMYKNHSVAKAN